PVAGHLHAEVQLFGARDAVTGLGDALLAVDHLDAIEAIVVQFETNVVALVPVADDPSQPLPAGEEASAVPPHREGDRVLRRGAVVEHEPAALSRVPRISRDPRAGRESFDAARHAAEVDRP